MATITQDYVEVRGPGQLYLYHDGGRAPDRVRESDARYARMLRTLTNDDYRLLHADGLRDGDRLIAAAIPASRTQSPEYAAHAAAELVELERRDDYGGLHHQAVAALTERCPGEWVDGVYVHYLPTGETTADLGALSRAWAGVYSVVTRNRDGGAIQTYAYTPA